MGRKLGPAEATKKINALAENPFLDLSKSPHAESRMAERNIISGDLLCLMRTGFIYDAAEPASREELWKYKIEGKTPNSESRVIIAIIIPDFKLKHIKIVTCYWKDKG